jgi:hypothetical protein
MREWQIRAIYHRKGLRTRDIYVRNLHIDSINEDERLPMMDAIIGSRDADPLWHSHRVDADVGAIRFAEHGDDLLNACCIGQAEPEAHFRAAGLGHDVE